LDDMFLLFVSKGICHINKDACNNGETSDRRSDMTIPLYL